MGENLTVLGLTAENVRALKAVVIHPPRVGVVTIKGRNGAGKSSAIGCIEMALCGRSAQPEKPIRHGQKGASITLDLGDALGSKYLVKEAITEKGTYLEVQAKGGFKVAKPQGFLDDLVGAGIGFDPEKFSRLKPAEQVQMLLDVLKLPEDPRLIDQQRKVLYEQRTVINRGLKQAEGHLASLPEVPEGTPQEEVSIEALVEEFNRRQIVIRQNQLVRDKAMQATKDREDTVVSCLRDLQGVEAHVAKLKAELEEAQQDLESLRPICTEMVETSRRTEGGARERALSLTDPDLSDIQCQMSGIQITNRHVATLKQRRDAEKVVAQVRKESETISETIEALDQKKATLLSQAQFPLETLGIEEDGKGGYRIMYGGVPLEDCSSSERMRISMALALSLNPKVRVLLVREGSMLDEESRGAIETWAVEHQCQIWLELATTSKEGNGFLIEAGELMEAQP